MNCISNNEYDELMKFMKSRILNLWRHENVYRSEEEQLCSTQTGFSITNIMHYYVDETTSFYLVYNNIFLNLITHQFPKAQCDYPEKFGTNNADDVIEALYMANGNIPDWFTIEQYKEILANKSCYVVYKHNGILDRDILRIDLYRHIQPNKTGGTDFIGGLLHALKHYSMNGLNLSTGHDINDVFDIQHVVYLAAMAFRHRTGDEYRYEANQELYNKSHTLKYSFYKEEESGVFFLNTSHLE